MADKYNDIKEVCGAFSEHLSFDKELITIIQKFRLQWATKSDVYIDFLGSHYVGAHEIRFSSLDEDYLYNDVFEMDMNILEDEIVKTKGINKAFKVSSNPTLLMLAYFMHRFTISSLPKDLKKLAIEELYAIFAYKILGSLYSNYFKYPVEEGVAKVVYERMTNKYLLKDMTWGDVINYRAMDLLEGGLHYSRLKTFTSDDAVRILNDLQTRLRDIIKKVYLILVEVKENNEKIGSDDKIDPGNEEFGPKFKESSGSSGYMVARIKDKMSFANDFISEKHLALLRDRKLFPKLETLKFRLFLNYVCENNITKTPKGVETIDTIVSLSMEYLIKNNIVSSFRDRVYDVNVCLRNFWSSSTISKNKDVVEIKDFFYKEFTKATGIRTPHTISYHVIAFIVYCVSISL